MHEQISHIPLGVVANISAWNYPWFVGCNVIVPALLTGNAVLYKPSEHATLTGLHITRLLHAAGVPADAMQCLVGAGEVGAALLEQRLDGVFFTGSHATGVRIAQAVAPQLLKLQLELGGKDPTYVRADADPLAAAESLADGAMYNTGQSCCSVERIYVHESLHDAFVEHFVATVKGMRLGDPLQRRHLHRRDHARAAAGGAAGPGGRRAGQGRHAAHRRPHAARAGQLVRAHRASPASNHTMELMREESFGPIIGIQKVAGDDEAVALMNDTRYGLTAGVYTRDESPGARAAGAGERRQRLLELLRPRQPAAALVGPRRFGRGPDAVHLRHPGLHAAQGLASAQPLTDRPQLAPDPLRPGPHAARRRQRPAVVRVPDGPRRAAARALRVSQSRHGARLCRRQRQRAGLLRLLHRHAGRAQRRRMAAAAPRVRRHAHRAAHHRCGLATGRAAPRRRRPGAADHGHLPLPERAERGAPGHLAADRHRMRDRCVGPLHRPQPGRAEHARRQGAAPARLAGAAGSWNWRTANRRCTATRSTTCRC